MLRPEARSLLSSPGSHNSRNTCCKCKLLGEQGRRLVVCIDGTSNQFGLRNTNVVELYNHIDKSASQLTYYNSGVGTFARGSKYYSYSSWKQSVYNNIDLAVAWNLKKIILGAYRWLSDNYKPGDQIFLFGFSRGAYQVRVLAGMIEKVGLLFAGNQEQIPFAYELYADLQCRGKPNTQDDMNYACHFKKTFSRPDVCVHFVGVWDTVSSVGIFRGKLLPLTDTCDHICFFRHALALDECRVKFLPECALGSKLRRSTDGVEYNEKIGSIKLHRALDDDKEIEQEHIKEVWFPGSHSDIGGGVKCNLDLSAADIPLRWMANEAMKAGLRLNPLEVEWDWDELSQSKPTKSLHHLWWILEHLPLPWLVYPGPTRTFIPHHGRGRMILPGQKLHASVAFKSTTYFPKAEFPSGETPWRSLIGHGYKHSLDWANGWKKVLEMDLFDVNLVRAMVSKFNDGLGADQEYLLNHLIFIGLSDEGQTALLETNIVSKLNRLLKRGNDAQRRLSAITLARFSKEARLHDEIQQTEVGQNLRNIIEDEEQVHWSAVHALIVIQSPCNDVIFDFLPILNLVKSITFAELFPENRRLLQSDFTETVLKNHKVVPRIIRMLVNKHLDPKEQKAAMEVLVDMTPLAEMRVLMLEDNIVLKVAKLLTSPHIDVQQQVLESLAYFVQYEDIRTAMRTDGTISLVMEFLQSHNSEVYEQYLRIVECFIQHDAICNEMVKKGIIPILMDLLGISDLNVSGRVLPILKHLSRIKEVHEEMLKNRVIPVMLKYIKHATRDSEMYEAFCILDEFVYHEGMRTALLKNRKIMKKLLKILNPHVQRHVLDTLCKFTRYDITCTMMVKQKVVPMICELLHVRNTRVRNMALKTLSGFAQSKEMRTEMLKTMIIFKLTRLLGSDLTRVQNSVLESKILCTFAQYDDIRTDMLKKRIIVHLIKHLKNSDVTVRQSSLWTLSMFAQYDDMRPMIIDKNLIHMIKENLNFSTRYGCQVQWSPLESLANFSNHEEMYEEILRENIFPELVELLKHPVISLRQGAIKILSTLAKHSKMRAAIIAEDIPPEDAPAIGITLQEAEGSRIAGR